RGDQGPSNRVRRHGFQPGEVRTHGNYRGRRGKIPRPPRLPPLLPLVVHHPPRRWRARTAAQGRAGPPRARLDPDDRGCLRPPVPARRRRCRAGGCRAGVAAVNGLVTPSLAFGRQPPLQSMPQNKLQHYVPKCHLRPFCLDSGGSAINLYNIARDRLIEGAPIKGQCARDYFYGKDRVLERALQEPEGAYAAIVDKAANDPGSITSMELGRLRE